MPALINQFNTAIDKPNAKSILKLLSKYRPESKQEKAARLKLRAAERVEGKTETIDAKPALVRYGIREVTTLVEQKKAQMVVIAHDVDPIEVNFGSVTNLYQQLPFVDRHAFAKPLQKDGCAILHHQG